VWVGTWIRVRARAWVDRHAGRQIRVRTGERADECVRVWAGEWACRKVGGHTSVRAGGWADGHAGVRACERVCGSRCVRMCGRAYRGVNTYHKQAGVRVAMRAKTTLPPVARDEGGGR
jgi:hypothetical protein